MGLPATRDRPPSSRAPAAAPRRSTTSPGRQPHDEAST
jgi:hypothetical protein